MLWDQREDTAVDIAALDRILDAVTIPPLPQAAARVLQMLRADDCAPADLAKVVTADPGMAAQILRLVNSADVGLPQEVADVRLAVSLLGMNRIKALVVGLSVEATLKSEGDGFDHASFWTSALQRAAFAEVLAARICPGQEGEAFTGGLLQDMAQPVLASQHAEHYGPVLRLSRGMARELPAVEMERLSWTHAEVGARIALVWNLPEILVDAIGMHHSDAETLAGLGLLKSPIAAVAASARLPYAAPFVADLGVPLETYPELAKGTDHICRGLSGLFGVHKPRRLPLPADSSLVQDGGDHSG